MPLSLIKYITEPWRIIVAFDQHVWSIVPDTIYIKALFRIHFGRKLNLNSPKTYCEKLQWLKIFDKNPIYGEMTDKYLVRNYLSSRACNNYLVPLLKVYDSVDEISFEELPNRFVLKCTHDSGSVIIVKDKTKLDYEETKMKLSKALHRDFWRRGRESAYSHHGKARIIAEKYIYEEENISEKPDYKFFCFGGLVKFFQVNVGRTTEDGVKVCFFDRNKKTMDIHEAAGYASAEIIELPSNIDEMIELAERLSAGIPHVRVDLLEYKGIIYFSEFTFYHCGGFFSFQPDKWDAIIGDWLHLPPKK